MSSVASKAVSPTLDRASLWACLVAAGAAVLPLGLLLPGAIVATMLVLLGFATAALWRRFQVPWLVRLPLTLGAAAVVMREYGVGFGGGFGRDTGAALLAVMLLLKLLELRSVRDGRAVLSFALFAIFAAFLQDRGPLTLSLALVATLLLLMGLARMAEVDTPGAGPPPALQLRARLRHVARLAALSLPLALVAFYLFPRLANPLWALPQNSAEARTGLSDSMGPGDIAELFLDDTPVMRVRFDGEPPPGQALYWRGPVLSQFDGRRWVRAGWSTALPAAPLEASGDRVSYELEQEPTDRNLVYALDLAIEAPTGHSLTYDRSLAVRRPLTAVSRHRLSSVIAYRLEPTLARTLRDDFLRLPGDFNPRTRALASQWRAEGANETELIRRALDWFNSDFRYTLTPLLLGRDSVDDFLFNTQGGYCEHFASAFAVLMRSAGVPARVVTGYQGGYINPLGGYMVVRQSDAHAWTEVWLEGRGWVRVDPTNAVAPERIDRGLDALDTSSRAWRGWGRPVFNALDWMRRGWNDFVLGFDAGRQSRLLQPFGVEQADWRQLGIALIAAGGLALALTLLLMLRPASDGRDAIGRAYQVFLRRLARRGAVKPPAEGPMAFAERLAAAFPGSAGRIHALSMRYTRRRYADDAVDPDLDRQLAADLRAFRIAREDRT